MRLGAGVLVAPWYRPVVLARSLTSLDVLSDRRLTVGLGAGGSRPDGLAGGASQRALDEALDVLAAVWGDIVLTDRPVEGHRVPHAGSIEQVVCDVDATRREGAHEVILASAATTASTRRSSTTPPSRKPSTSRPRPSGPSVNPRYAEALRRLAGR